MSYVISGRAELYSEGENVVLVPGDSWVVPKGARHAYKITPYLLEISPDTATLRKVLVTPRTPTTS